MTNTPETEQALVTVTREDIDALFQSGHPLSRDSKEAIEAGEWDHHHLLQAFARHREQAQRTEPSAGEVERVAEAVRAAQGCGLTRDGALVFCEQCDCHEIATAAIQAMRGGQGERVGIVACEHCGDTGKVMDRVDGEITCPDCGYAPAAQAIERGDFLPGEGRRR